jgi:hypothetical protein
MKHCYAERIPQSILLALVSLASLAPSAHAAYEPLSSGSTKLLLDSSFLSALKSQGMSLAVRAPAKLRGSVVSFPVVGGKFDPTSGRGEVEHDGALLFKAGRRNIPMRSLQLKTTRQSSPLAAKVGGSQLKLATAANLETARAGFGEKISVSKLALSAKLATRLAKKLDARGVFETGMALGRTTTHVIPQTIVLASNNKVELSLDPGFQAKLDSLFVAVNPVFPAEHQGPFTLPVFGGTVSPDAGQGTVETLGSLEFLQLGGGQVLWHEPWLDLGSRTFAPEAEILPSPPYAGKQERASAAGFELISTSANARDRTVSIAGRLFMDTATAATFNEVFAKPQGKADLFAGGEAVGAITFTGQGQ